MGKKKTTFPDFNYLIDGLDATQKTIIDNSIKQALEIREDKVSELEEQVTKLDSMVAEKQSKIDELNGTVDGLKNQLTEQQTKFDESFNQSLKERRELDKTLELIEFKGDSDDLSAREIKEKVIKFKFPDMRLDGQTEDYINGIFVTVKEVLQSSSKDNSRSRRQEKFDSQSQELNDIVRIDFDDTKDSDRQDMDYQEDGGYGAKMASRKKEEMKKDMTMMDMQQCKIDEARKMFLRRA